MALFRWRGDGAGVKSDFDDGRNWVNENGTLYAQAVYPGVVPAQFDDVIFDEALDPTNPALSCAVYDAVVAGDEELNSFKVGPEYDGTIATGGFLKFNCDRAASETLIEATAAGVINIENEAIDGASTRHRVVRVIDSGSIVTLKGVFTGSEFFKGTVVLDSIYTAATFFTGYIDSTTSDLTLTIPNVTALPALVICDGGTITCSEPITTLRISNGKWTQVTGNIGTLTMYGGIFNWQDGDITTIAVVYGGLLDGSNSAAPRTILEAELYPAGFININNGLRNIVLTNQITTFGGTIEFSPGEEVSI